MFDKNQEELTRKRDKANDILKEWEKTLVMKHRGYQEEKEINSKIQYTGVI